MKPRALYVDSCDAIRDIDADGLFCRKWVFAHGIVEWPGSIVGGGNCFGSEGARCRELAEEAACGRTAKQRRGFAHDAGSGGFAYEAIAFGDMGKSVGEAVAGDALRLHIGDLVEDQDARIDARAMFDEGLAHEQVKPRRKQLLDNSVSVSTARMRGEPGRHDRNAATARGKPQKCRAEVTGAGMGIIAARRAAAVRRIDENDGRADDRREKIVDIFGIVARDDLAEHAFEQCGALGIDFIEMHRDVAGKPCREHPGPS
ncbi:hypothetical protein Sj15T_10190 [Sphingobium sp. TA15]|nr:hypothetical protein Sj15T_10190 [Sphingobium sp. TA15]